MTVPDFGTKYYSLQTTTIIYIMCTLNGFSVDFSPAFILQGVLVYIIHCIHYSVHSHGGFFYPVFYV